MHVRLRARRGSATAPRAPLDRWRLASHALTLVGALLAVQYWLLFTLGPSNGWDAGIYWRVRLDDMYGGWVVGGADAYQYAPAFVQLLAPLHVLPFEAFLALWRAMALAVVVALAGPLTLPVLLWSPVASEINAGNVNILLAGAIALGFRYPAAWAFVLLTKITPGVGLLWFAARREWRRLAVALGATAAVALCSFVLSPGQWLAWVTLIVSNSGASVVTFPYWVPLSVRLPVAVAVVLVAARLGWRWAVPVAAVVAAPVLYFPTQAIAVGALPFVRESTGRWRDEQLARWRTRRSAAPADPREAPQAAPERDGVPAQVLR